MIKTMSRSARSTATRFVPGVDRRARLRLRDLCDEVLASYRVANGRDPISDEDRMAANALLPQLDLRPGR